VIKRLTLIAVLIASVLTACGKGDTTPAASGDPTTSSTEATTTTTTAAPAQAATLTATEYAYAGTDLSFSAGPLAVTLRNDGKEEHQATIVRFKDGKSLGDLAGVAANDPGAIDTVVDVFGGPNAVAPGGGSVTATQSLEPGDYYFMCFIPAADGTPHAAKGMVAPFTVTGDASAAAPVTADKRIVLKEYGFGTGDDALLEAGSYVVRNEGEQLHEMALYAPAAGKTIDDVRNALRSETPPSGPLPYVPAGGIGPIDPGTSAQVDLAKGEYVFVCFLPDRSDGKPHLTKGMIQAVSVE
jgi:hypothetical protein